MGTLRLYLALSVVVFHLSGPRLPFVVGPFAVIIFYMISGFYMAMVIQEKYAKRSTFVRDFYLTRLLRLWPTYAAVLLFTMAFDYVAGREDAFIRPPEAGDMARIAIILSNLTTIGFDIYEPARTFGPLWDWRAVPIAWSLTIEAQFYLAAPFLLARSFRLLIAVAVALVLVRLALLGWNAIPWRYFFAPSVWCFFLIGAASYRLMGIASRTPPKSAWAIVGAAPAIGYVSGLTGSVEIDTPGLWLAYLACAACLPFLHARMGRCKWDRRIGELSYPLYLVHLLVGTATPFVLHAFGIIPGNMPVSLIAIMSSLCLAVLLRVAIEIPVDHLRSRIAEPKRRRLGVAGAGSPASTI
jgi:peptidoglycan/LPS O-acetylase OafA/YrhL